MTELIAGALERITGAEDVKDELKGCMKESNHLIKDVEKTLKDLESMTVQGAIKGVQGIGPIMNEWPKALAGCSKLKHEVKDLKKRFLAPLKDNSYWGMA